MLHLRPHMYFAIAVFCSFPAYGDTPSAMVAIETAYKACKEVDDTGTGMWDCATEALAKADTLMGRVYQRMIDNLGAENRNEVVKRLKNSQSAWLKFRDAHCLLDASNMLDGSGESFNILYCSYYLTSIRAGELERQMLQLN